MRFELLLNYWKLRENMILHTSCLTRDKVYESNKDYVTYFMTVGNGNMHANLTYKYLVEEGTKSNFSLLHADILFSGFPDVVGPGAAVFIKNAKMSDLAEHIK